MPRCFVMQPFDRGVFDKRYDDVFAPAIVAAGLEPYRVDRDPSVSIPIEDIEKGIRDSEVCLAEITTDNPNVWFELGYAIAAGKEVVLLASEPRDRKFPFDIQHRHIISYRSESPRDFEALRDAITARLKAALSKERQLAQLDNPIRQTEGLDYHEIAALVTIMQSGLDPDNAPSAYSIKQDMGKAGFTEIATVLAVKRLQQMGFVQTTTAGESGREAYTAFIVSETGERWLLENQDRILLRRSAKPERPSLLEEDDLPF